MPLFSNADPRVVDYRISYQRDIFQKRFYGSDIHFSESGELISVYGASYNIDNCNRIGELFITYKDLFGLSLPDCKMELLKRSGSKDISIYHFKKVCNGIRVENESVNILVNRNKIFGITSNSKNYKEFYPDFLLDEISVIKYVKENLRSIGLGHVIENSRAYYGIGSKMLPIFRVKVMTKVPGIGFKYYISALDGQILLRQPLMRNAMGKIFYDSPEKDKKTSVVNLPEPLSPRVLKNDIVDVYSNCEPERGCDEQRRYALGDQNGDFMFEPDETKSLDPFAEVMAYYHINRLYSWFVDSQIDFSPFSVRAVVNFSGVGSEYDEYFQCNAFYSNRAIIVGLCPHYNRLNASGENINLSYDADIIMHEMTHSIFDEIYDLYPVVDHLGYSGMLSGINEAIADFIPSHITDDSDVGRHTSKMTGGRYLRRLTLLRRCPDYLAGEPHLDGEIVSTALWNARDVISDRDLFAKAIFLSIGALNSSSSFKDFYEQVVEFTTQLFNRDVAEDIKRPFIERNIDNCGRIIKVENGFEIKGYLMSAMDLGTTSVVPYEVQFVYDVPPGNELITIDISAVNYSGSTAEDYVRFYANINRPVDFSFDRINADYTWIKRSIKIENPAGGRYYVLPAGDGEGLYFFTFRFAYKEPAPIINLVDPERIRVGETVDILTINGGNFRAGAKVKMPYGITFEDSEVIDQNNIILYNVMVSKETEPGYKSIIVTNPDGQRVIGKNILLIVKGNDSCKCDISFECDENCRCDLDCDSGGCSCSLL